MSDSDNDENDEDNNTLDNGHDDRLSSRLTIFIAVRILEVSLT